MFTSPKLMAPFQKLRCIAPPNHPTPEPEAPAERVLATTTLRAEMQIEISRVPFADESRAPRTPGALGGPGARSRGDRRPSGTRDGGRAGSATPLVRGPAQALEGPGRTYENAGPGRGRAAEQERTLQ